MTTSTTATTATATKQYEQPKNDEWTDEEEQVFEEFGIGEGDVSMRKLIRGQRSINKRFYETLEVVLDRLPKVKNQKTGKDEELDRVIELNKGVPGDSPGCGG